ncbi:hypothetical protein GPALN_002169 [Globodera pallida]|nr:hypothetical protein GPALN_002169 [Globodera pallida]
MEPKTEFDQFFDEKLEHKSFQEPDQKYYTSSQEHLDQSVQQQDQSSNNESDQSSSLADSDHSDQDLKSNDDKQTKLMMVQQFDEYKEELKRNKTFDYRQRTRIDCEIAQKIGTTRWNIYKWRRALGIKQMPRAVDEHTKLELIDQFDKMMKDRRPENAYQNNQHCKIALEIAKELGTSRDNIYQWKRELGKTQKPNKQYVDDYDDETKLARHRVKIEGKIANKLGIYRAKIIQWKSEIGRQSMEDRQTKLKLIKKFDQIKNEYKQKNMFENEQRVKIECDIAKKLGTNRDCIYKWKRQLGSAKKLYTSEQKREIIEQFDKLKEQFARKFKSKPTKQIEEKFAQKFDISARSIHNWKRDFEKRNYTDSERLELIAKFDKMKRNNTTLSDEHIAESLGIKMSTIKQWRRKLGVVTK